MTSRCPHCAHENRAERRFCGSCGEALEHACRSCGFPNGPVDRFCGGCGARLAGRQLIARPTLATLEVLDLDAMWASASHDNLPPVLDDIEGEPLDSGEFRALFDL